MPSLVTKLLITAQAATQVALAWESPEWLNKLKEERESKHYSATGDDHLYVHFISHTHDDVGWLKTVDEYFTGTN